MGSRKSREKCWDIEIKERTRNKKNIRNAGKAGKEVGEFKEIKNAGNEVEERTEKGKEIRKGLGHEKKK